ncbi:MAG: glycosyltransferase [Candidatus Neomarinimicrobiota bacterium]
MRQRLLIVGNPGVTHIGAHFVTAAKALRLKIKLCDTNAAWDAAWPVTKFNWWLRGHRPPHLRQFSRHVLRTCESKKPTWILLTGLAPVERSILEEIGEMDIVRLLYLTDDPWNPAHKGSWFLQTLPFFERVYSPRRSNLEDLKGIGCNKASYLPFAFDPETHFPEQPAEADKKDPFAHEIVFIGGADADRTPYISALIREGFEVGLYGGYWERFSSTRSRALGHVDPQSMRKIVAESHVALCLVRRANRDGHAMRSYELPAMGACMLVEDTQEHREILGQDGDNVVYFSTVAEMIGKLRWLLKHEEERTRLSEAVRAHVIKGRNTYGDRLLSMLQMKSQGKSASN